MTPKRRALSALSKSELLDVARVFGLPVVQRMNVDDILGHLARSKRATLDKILPQLADDAVIRVAQALSIATAGFSRAQLVDRILGEGGEGEPTQASLPLGAPSHVPAEPAVAPFVLAPASSEAVSSGRTAAVAHSPVVSETPLAVEASLTVEVTPRQPRLAWQGMDRREEAVEVPTQVVEIVRPGRAVERDDSLLNTEVRAAKTREGAALPPNRLIWTNDNLVALQTLLDERDPRTKEYRYRGKVDLVYIDPPFMVNNDFRADNAIDIDIDDEEGVQVKKEPSLVEILAYKDTWRQGLDSFLSMLKRRLELLKDLLAPTGSIYVHLDWHAVHYVKVLMDEIFGYENLVNEIHWKRTSSRAGTIGFNHIHDTILSYGVSSSVWFNSVKVPHDSGYVRAHYRSQDEKGRFRTIVLTAPGIRSGETGGAWRGILPTKGRHWAYKIADLDRFDAEGMIRWPKKAGGMPELKQYLDDFNGMQAQSLWLDIPAVNSQAMERLGFPTQKPVELVERVISSSSPPGGLVLDCFLGSGTTAEAAERLDRRWVGIDNGKYAIHLTRKRLIQLDGQLRPPERPQHEYIECEHCKNIDRKEKPQRSPGPFKVQPFTVENMGVYQRAEQWQHFQTERSAYRDEMIKVFGGEPIAHSELLHGKKGDAWVHVGPLDAPIASGQVWAIAREAGRTGLKAVTVLSADYNTLAASEKEEIKERLGVSVTIRVIPASAIDEVARRIALLRKGADVTIESMAIPAFYAPLSIVLRPEVSGRRVRVTLERCEVDIESFIASQRPVLKPVTEGMSAAARKKAQAELDKWTARRKELEGWLEKADTWKKFVDFWAVDWEYGHRQGADGKPIFETSWQSFRTRKGKGEVEDLVFTAELVYPQDSRYRVAARVTDVFGNDGIAAVDVDIR